MTAPPPSFAAPPMLVSAESAPRCLSFEDVYRQHADAVYRFCLSQVANPATAEDLAATGFELAFRAFKRVNPDPEGVRAWLFRIVRNLAVDHHRRKQRLHHRLGRIFWSSPQSSPDAEEITVLRDDLTTVNRAIAELKPRDQVLVGLRVAADLSYADIAAITGLREGTVKVAVHRALVRVRAQLEEMA